MRTCYMSIHTFLSSSPVERPGKNRTSNGTLPGAGSWQSFRQEGRDGEAH